MARESELTALMISPDRAMAEQFARTIPTTRAFQILADLKSYPHEQTLDIRLRQLRPDVVLLDLVTNLELAGDLIRFIVSTRPDVHVIGLHTENNSDCLVRSLRAGASEFLYAPFEVGVQREAIQRIRRLRRPIFGSQQTLGRIVVFTSAKPGSGATTLAVQSAFALRRTAGKPVLLVDFDLMGGSIGFYLKLAHGCSALDAMESAGRLDAALWSSFVTHQSGVDVLPAPEVPVTDTLEPARLHDVLEYARTLYDWVMVDLPAVFHRVSLLALSESDSAFLVTTSELPSLHLTRKAVNLLGQLGIEKDRYRVVVNRVGKHDGVAGSDMEKIFGCPVHATFPNDYFSLHRVVTLGQPLGTDCELGRAVENLAGKLSGAQAGELRRSEALVGAKPVLSES